MLLEHARDRADTERFRVSCGSRCLSNAPIHNQVVDETNECARVRVGPNSKQSRKVLKSLSYFGIAGLAEHWTLQHIRNVVAEPAPMRRKR